MSLVSRLLKIATLSDLRTKSAGLSAALDLVIQDSSKDRKQLWEFSEGMNSRLATVYTAAPEIAGLVSEISSRLEKSCLEVTELKARLEKYESGVSDRFNSYSSRIAKLRSSLTSLEARLPRCKKK